jgi:hypothetical protein
VLGAGTLMIILDGTIVHVAPPSIQRDLGFSQTDLARVVGSYPIAFGGLLLLSARLGDLLARRRSPVARAWPGKRRLGRRQPRDPHRGRHTRPVTHTAPDRVSASPESRPARAPADRTARV